MISHHLCAHFTIICTNNPTFLFGDFNYRDLDWSIPVNLGSFSHDCFLTVLNCLQNDLLLVSNPPHFQYLNPSTVLVIMHLSIPNFMSKILTIRFLHLFL